MPTPPTPTTTPAPLPRRHALESAYRLGLVCFRNDQAMVTPDWRPLWWALTEFGELHPRLLPHLPGADTQLPRLSRLGWLSTGRAPGRPAHTLAPTRPGRDALAARSPFAPPWRASSREVARRLIARLLTDATEPLTASEITERAITGAAGWGRLIQPDDVRAVLLADRRAGLLRRLPPPPGSARLTVVGYRVVRGIARATGEHLPRHSRVQDIDHDALLSEAALRLVAACPALVGALRIARRVRLPSDPTHRQRWIIPDGLVVLDTAHGRSLLAVEVERRSRYDDLTEHIQNYQRLAVAWPGVHLRILVVSPRITPGRRDALADALRSSCADRVTAEIRTVAGVTAQVTAWGIRPDTPAFDPSTVRN